MTARLLACALPAAQAMPAPGPATEASTPQPIVTGSIVMPLFPADSPFLKKDRLAEPEVYNMLQSVPGGIQSIVNIHNPSIEVHPVDTGINTGALVILVPGGDTKRGFGEAESRRASNRQRRGCVNGHGRRAASRSVVGSCRTVLADSTTTHKRRYWTRRGRGRNLEYRVLPHAPRKDRRPEPVNYCRLTTPHRCK